MKKVLFLALMAVAIFAACNKEEIQSGEKTALTVSISGGASTRATTTMTPANLLSFENEVKSLEVLVFSQASGVKEAQQTIMGLTGTVNGLSMGNKRVVVVANPPAALKAQLSGATSYADLNDPAKVNLDLISQTEMNGTRNSAVAFTMTGETTVALQAGANNQATIKVERVVAKVQLGNVSIQPATGYDANKLVLSKVHVQKVRSKSQIGRTDYLIANNTLFNWMGGTTVGATVTETADAGRFSGTLLNTGTTVTTNNNDFFYVMPNDNSGNNCTLLTIEGTYDGVLQYYVFRINDQVIPGVAESGTYVRNNRHYTLNVTLKRLGDGSPDPDTPSDPATLDVTVEVMDWVVVPVQNVEW